MLEQLVTDLTRAINELNANLMSYNGREIPKRENAPSETELVFTEEEIVAPVKAPPRKRVPPSAPAPIALKEFAPVVPVVSYELVAKLAPRLYATHPDEVREIVARFMPAGAQGQRISNLLERDYVEVCRRFIFELAKNGLLEQEEVTEFETQNLLNYTE